MVSIVICGWYGNGNLGDELILESILHQLRTAFPDVRVTVFSDNPELTSGEFHVAAIRRRDGFLNRLRRMQAISRADLFILGGGGILMDYGHATEIVPRWLGGMKCAQKFGLPNMTYSVGVGKIWTEEGRAAVQSILTKANAICVRDQESASMLMELNVPGAQVTSDVALIHPLLQNREAMRRDKGSPFSVLVCLRQWFDTDNSVADPQAFKRMKKELALYLSKLSAEKNARIVFVPCRCKGQDDDRTVAREVISLMTHTASAVVQEAVPSVPEFLNQLRNADLLIAMRLHSLIAAAALRIPAIAINYAPKVKNFMNSIGAGAWVLEVGEVTSGRLTTIAASFVTGYPIEVSRSCEEMQDKARQNTKVAVSLVQKVMRTPPKRKAGFLVTLAALTSVIQGEAF